MTVTLADPWIERQIREGRLAPGARGLSRETAAEQHNEANALGPADPDWLYTPGQAQQVARDALAMIGIEVPEGTRMLLTDGRAGPRCSYFLLNAGQVEMAVEEHRLCTGEAISIDALIGALPWE